MEWLLAMIPMVADRTAELERLCVKHQVARLDIFGSAVRGTFDPNHSDLDFLVEFQEVPDGDHAKEYFGLASGLEQLFGRPVDLVTRKAIKNPYFLQSVEATKTSVYESGIGCPPMRLETKKYLFDIREAASNLQEFTSGRTFDDYQSDTLLRSAIERQLINVGEALNQLRRQDEAAASKVSEIGQIVSFRNRLVHGYSDIDDEIVWNVLTNDVPSLVGEVETLLAEGDNQ